ncbi:MAG: DUF4845 domain-containing protein [Woeseiaceae bacterium]
MNYPNGLYSPVMARQRGMTTLGLIILVVFVGLFVYAGMRLGPVYMENLKVSGTLEKVEEEFSGTNATQRKIRSSIEKRFDVESVNAISFKDVLITKAPNGFDVTANYTNTVPFIANIHFAVKFDNQVLVVK